MQYLWFIFFLDFDHSCIETVKSNESRNKECTYLRFDISNSKLGLQCNTRLRSNMAKFSDMSYLSMPGVREE